MVLRGLKGFIRLCLLLYKKGCYKGLRLVKEIRSDVEVSGFGILGLEHVRV